MESRVSKKPAPLFLALGRSLRDCWRDLIILSFAGLATSVLVVTVIGGPPGVAALYAIARAAALHEGPDAALYVETWRAYFSRSWLLGLLAVVTIGVSVFDLGYYWGALAVAGPVGWFGGVLLLFGGIVWLQTLSYAWPLMVSRADLRLSQLLRNGLVISLRFPLHNAVSGVFTLLLLAASVIFPPLVVLVVPPLVALLGFHNLYLLAPELVPEEIETLEMVS